MHASAVAPESVDSSCDSSSRCRTLLAWAEQRATLERITNENWYTSTSWEPTLGTISSRFNCPHEHCRPHGISLQNGREQLWFLPTCPDDTEFTILAASWTESDMCALTERGFRPPQATPFPTAVVRRTGRALAQRLVPLPISPLVRGCPVGHRAPCQLDRRWAFRGMSLPRAKVRTPRGTGQALQALTWSAWTCVA